MTAVRPRYTTIRRPGVTTAAHLYMGCCIEVILLRLAGQRPSMCYITVTLMTFDKQSNGRRIEVESLVVYDALHVLYV